MKKQTIKKLKIIAKICQVFIILIVIANVIGFYNRFHEDKSFLKFFTEDRVYYLEDGEIPAIAKEQAQAYNDIVKIIWLALLFTALIIGLDYLIDKENHFITRIKERLDRANV